MGQDIVITNNPKVGETMRGTQSEQAQGLPEIFAAPESPLCSLVGPDLNRASIRAEMQPSAAFAIRIALQAESAKPDALKIQINVPGEFQDKQEASLLSRFIDAVSINSRAIAEFLKTTSEEHLPKWLSKMVVASIDITMELPTLVQKSLDYLGKKADSCWQYVCDKCAGARDWALEFFAPAFEFANKLKDSISDFLSGKQRENIYQPELALGLAMSGLTDGEKKLSHFVPLTQDAGDDKFDSSIKSSLKIFEILNEFAEVLREAKREIKVHAEIERQQFEEKKHASLVNIAQAIASHPESADFIRSRVQSAYAEVGLAYDDVTDGELAALVEAAHLANRTALVIPIQPTNITDITNARSSQVA